MIKPAWSGDLRITTGLFFLPTPSLPAEGRYNYWEHKSLCAEAESQPIGGYNSGIANTF